jgi:hypothetical protein
VSNRDGMQAAGGGSGLPADRPAADAGRSLLGYGEVGVQSGDTAAADADHGKQAGDGGLGEPGEAGRDIGGGSEAAVGAVWRPQWRAAAALVVVTAVLVTAGVLWGPHRRQGSGPPSGAVSPTPGLPTTVGQLLRHRAAALLVGDEAGWLRDVDPAKPQLIAQLRTRYRTLRALQVSGWDEAVLDSGGNAPLSAPVVMRVKAFYCLARPGCVIGVGLDIPFVEEKIGFTPRGGRVWLTDLAELPVDPYQHVPVPWQSGPLQTRTGSRVILAAPPELAGRLQDALVRAEQAAQVADRYARFAKAPDHYLVYLAGPSQWTQWFGGLRPGIDALGYAIPLSRLDMQVVIDASHVPPDQMQLVLQHEFGHVVTLNDAEPQYHLFDDNAWLSEGVAEYIAWAGRSPASYYRLDDVRRYLRTGWDGQLYGIVPEYTTRNTSAAYGISYLALRYLADRYGEQAMLAFVNAVRRQNRTVYDAAEDRLGKPWTVLNKECANYIRAVAR